MNEEITRLINAIGAIAEVSGALHAEFMKNGFTRRESLELVKTWLSTTVKSDGNKEEKE